MWGIQLSLGQNTQGGSSPIHSSSPIMGCILDLNVVPFDYSDQGTIVGPPFV